MTRVIKFATRDLTEFARMRALAAEAEALAPVDADASRKRLQELRALVARLSSRESGRHADDFVRIVDTLDADLSRGGVRSITGLTRQVRRLEAAARPTV